MEPVPQSVTVKRTRGDYFAFSKAACKEVHNVQVYMCVTMFVLFFVSLHLLDLSYVRKFLPAFMIDTDGVSFVTFVGLLVSASVIVLRFFRPAVSRATVNDGQNFLRENQVTINEHGIGDASEAGTSFMKWRSVYRIEKTKTLLLAYVDKVQAYCIPIRNFTTPQEADAFYESMLAYWRKAHGKA